QPQRRRGDPPGPGRRHHRCDRDRPCAAPPRREGLRVRQGGVRDRRAGDDAAAVARAGAARLSRSVAHDRCALDAAGEDSRHRQRHACRRRAGRHRDLRSGTRLDASRGRNGNQEPQHSIRRMEAERKSDLHARRRRGRLVGHGIEGEHQVKATLALADGRIFRGRGFGAEGKVGGEVVFNTSLSGYQEILTDPSYDGQIVVMTYPEIGNTGINAEDVESKRPYLAGFVVKEHWDAPSNWRSQRSLADYMKENGIVGIEWIDTRALVRHIRDHGAQQAVLATGDVDEQQLVREASERASLVGQDLATGVTTESAYRWIGGAWDLEKGYLDGPSEGPLVAAFDYGLK